MFNYCLIGESIYIGGGVFVEIGCVSSILQGYNLPQSHHSFGSVASFPINIDDPSDACGYWFAWSFHTDITVTFDDNTKSKAGSAYIFWLDPNGGSGNYIAYNLFSGADISGNHVSDPGCEWMGFGYENFMQFWYGTTDKAFVRLVVSVGDVSHPGEFVVTVNDLKVVLAAPVPGAVFGAAVAISGATAQVVTAPPQSLMQIDTLHNIVAVAESGGGIAIYVNKQIIKNINRDVRSGAWYPSLPFNNITTDIDPAGVVFLPDGRLITTYNQSGNGYYFINTSHGDEGHWNPIPPILPLTLPGSRVGMGRAQGQLWAFRNTALANPTSPSGTIYFSRCGDNRGATWKDQIVAANDTQGPGAGGVWLDNGYGLIYTKSDNKIYWKKAVNPTVWPADPGTSTGLTGQVIGLARNSAKILCALLDSGDGSGQVKVAQSLDGGLSWVLTNNGNPIVAPQGGIMLYDDFKGKNGTHLENHLPEQFGWLGGYWYLGNSTPDSNAPFINASGTRIRGAATGIISTCANGSTSHLSHPDLKAIANIYVAGLGQGMVEWFVRATPGTGSYTSYYGVTFNGGVFNVVWAGGGAENVLTSYSVPGGSYPPGTSVIAELDVIGDGSDNPVTLNLLVNKVQVATTTDNNNPETGENGYCGVRMLAPANSLDSNLLQLDSLTVITSVRTHVPPAPVLYIQQPCQIVAMEHYFFIIANDPHLGLITYTSLDGGKSWT